MGEGCQLRSFSAVTRVASNANANARGDPSPRLGAGCSPDSWMDGWMLNLTWGRGPLPAVLGDHTACLRGQ